MGTNNYKCSYRKVGGGGLADYIRHAGTVCSSLPLFAVALFCTVASSFIV